MSEHTWATVRRLQQEMLAEYAADWPPGAYRIETGQEGATLTMRWIVDPDHEDAPHIEANLRRMGFTFDGHAWSSPRPSSPASGDNDA